MKLTIVGVGQTFNFSTGEMDDVLHVQAEDGRAIVVPTTNEAVSKLIKLAMNGINQPQGHSSSRGITDQFQQSVMNSQLEMDNSPYPVNSTGNLSGEEFPEGADIFGGGGEPTEDDKERFKQMLMNTAPTTGDPTHGNPEGPHLVMDGQQLLQQVQETVIGRSSGIMAKINDRSGVATRTLSGSLVDSKGNPVMPSAPSSTEEDEDDPGEQI